MWLGVILKDKGTRAATRSQPWLPRRSQPGPSVLQGPHEWPMSRESELCKLPKGITQPTPLCLRSFRDGCRANHMANNSFFNPTQEKCPLHCQALAIRELTSSGYRMPTHSQVRNLLSSPHLFFLSQPQVLTVFALLPFKKVTASKVFRSKLVFFLSFFFLIYFWNSATQQEMDCHNCLLCTSLSKNDKFDPYKNQNPWAREWDVFWHLCAGDS